MFPPEPEKPWWYHLSWALPAMLAFGGLGWWLGSRGQETVEVIKEVTKVVTMPTNGPVVYVTNSPAPRTGTDLAGQPEETNHFTASRGVPVETNRADALRIGLTPMDRAQRDAPGFDVTVVDFSPRAPRTDFEIQVALDRAGYSPGSIDGMSGPQTQAAVVAFQHRNGLPVTGAVDAATRKALTLESAAMVTRTVSTNDLARLERMGRTWTEKSKQSALAYESVLEMFAEQHHCSMRYLAKVNPTVTWGGIEAGTVLKVPHTALPLPAVNAELIHIQLAQQTLDVYDGATNLVARFPCSIATRVDKRPVGRLEITTIAEEANYTFDPARFPDSPEARAGGGKLIIPPGPNNPVGTTWLSLSRDGYGIHGTPDPEKVGRTTSLGCFRLSNWNVRRLARMVKVGTTVLVE